MGETLEEYLERGTEGIIEPNVKALAKSYIRYGAEWQKERMYSEDDLREAFKQSRQALIFEKDMPPVHNEFEDWFEQFKKK